MVSFFMYYMLYAIVVPYFQVYLSRKGLSPRLTGLTIGVWEVAGILGPFLLGYLANLRGRFRTILLVCALLSTAMLYIMLPVENYLLLLGLTVIFGIIFKPMMPVMDAMVSITLENPQREYGYVRVAGSIGFSVLMLILLIGKLFEAPTASRIAAGAAITGTLFLLSLPLMPATGGSRGERVRFSVRHLLQMLGTEYVLLIAVVFLSRLGFSSYYSFFSLFLQDELLVEDVGVYWMIATLAEIAPILFGGVIIEKIRRYNAIFLGITAMLIRLLIYALVRDLLVIGITQILHAFTFGILHVACLSYINEHIPARHRTFAISIYIAIGWGLSTFIGSPLCGLLIETWGYGRMYATMALLPALSLVILLVRRITTGKSAGELF